MEKILINYFLDSYFWAYNIYLLLSLFVVFDKDYEKYKKIKIDNGTYFDDFGRLTSIVGLALYIMSIKLT